MFTMRGREPLTGMDMRLPIRRPGYITGTLRRPCCTKTIAKMVATKTMMVAPSRTQRFCSSLIKRTRLLGKFTTIPAKMIRERPCLRIPYSEINSPSQIANIVPPVIAINTVMDERIRSPLNPKGMICDNPN